MFRFQWIDYITMVLLGADDILYGDTGGDESKG
jgi:hypothetical protein